MVIDTSAILAILMDEPEAGHFRQVMGTAGGLLLSAVSALEATCVLESRKGELAGAELELLIFKLPITVAPFDETQLEMARQAWRKYGKGRHPAGLNFGDCAAYALAKATGQALLFKGGDFAKTDIRQAGESHTAMN
jgi:ribonuclease VapC